MVLQIDLGRGVVKGLGHDDVEGLAKGLFVAGVEVGSDAAQVLGEVGVQADPNDKGFEHDALTLKDGRGCTGVAVAGLNSVSDQNDDFAAVGAIREVAARL